jgi:hypothetical protein
MKPLKQLVSGTVAALVLLASGSAAADGTCVITCPANTTLATAPGAPAVVFPYTVTTTGTCGGIVQTAGLPPGSSFPVGTTTNVWRANDPPQQSCQFSVTVTATPAAARPSQPIPLLGPLGLGLLAAALAGGGALATRRRSTRR